jgi:hypothetical protein
MSTPPIREPGSSLPIYDSAGNESRAASPSRSQQAPNPSRSSTPGPLQNLTPAATARQRAMERMAEQQRAASISLAPIASSGVTNEVAAGRAQQLARAGNITTRGEAAERLRELRPPIQTRDDCDALLEALEETHEHAEDGRFNLQTYRVYAEELGNLRQRLPATANLPSSVGIPAGNILTAAANPLNLSPAEQHRIGRTHGGGITLAFIADNHDELAAVLSPADIVRVAGNAGGAQALQAVLTHRTALTGAGFSHADIVRVAGNAGGAQALGTLINQWPALSRYTRDQIMSAATRRRGAAGALRALANA